MKSATTEGMICLADCGLLYRVARIAFVEFEDESFRYEFYPNYRVIDLLGSDVFQGIPGLDLELRQECYVRENITPVFIEERSPAPNRDGLWELLDAQGMQRLNRLEWLMRSESRYSGDVLCVRRLDESDGLRVVQLESRQLMGRGCLTAASALLEPFCRGQELVYDGVRIDEASRAQVHTMLRAVYLAAYGERLRARREGIERAKGEGKYRGRKRKELDPLMLRELVGEVRAGRMKAQEAAQRLGIGVATFYRRMKELGEPGD